MDTNLAVEHERAHVGFHGPSIMPIINADAPYHAHRDHTKGSNGSKISFLNLVHASGMGTTPGPNGMSLYVSKESENQHGACAFNHLLPLTLTRYNEWDERYRIIDDPDEHYTAD